MNDYNKINITRHIAEHFGFNPLLSQTHILIWQNPSRDYDFRLTEQGMLALIQAGYKNHFVKFPRPIIWSSRITLRCTRFVKCPYYHSTKGITLFDDKIAVELMLFGGDLELYFNSKLASDKIS